MVERRARERNANLHALQHPPSRAAAASATATPLASPEIDTPHNAVVPHGHQQVGVKRVELYARGSTMLSGNVKRRRKVWRGKARGGRAGEDKSSWRLLYWTAGTEEDEDEHQEQQEDKEYT